MPTRRTSPARVLASLTSALTATALVGGALGLALSAPAQAAQAARTQPHPRPAIISADVSFDVVNANDTSVSCMSDNADYTLRGQLVGPRGPVLHGTQKRVTVLVNGLSTGSWLWQLPGHSAVDYARQLANKGETTLVLGRLGYGRSPLADPRSTCLGAQADMLHQVVQELKSGMFRFTGAPHRQVANAGLVVLQGHAVGALISEIEAATYHDVAGLITMSWADGRAAMPDAATSAQMRACVMHSTATYGGSDATYRSLLFASASSSVQSAAVARRMAAPCGDVNSLTQAESAGRQLVGGISVPVLLLHGTKDALVSDAAARAQRTAYAPAATVTFHDLAGAGSALPLEHAAPVVRRDVVSWLRSTFDRG